MKKCLLLLVLCAFAVSFSPVASAATTDALTTAEALPFFKKKKTSERTARYKLIKKNKKSYTKKPLSQKKRKFRF